MRGTFRSGGFALLAAVAAVGLAACGDDDKSGGGGGDRGGGGKKIALLLPESKTTRYEEHDRPGFTDKVKAICPDCQVLYSNASQDPVNKRNQAEAALTNGADVIVLDAVDAKSAVGIVNSARQKNVPVLAYDRMIANAQIDYYVSFDNVNQGRIQAKTLLGKLGDAKGKSIVMVNGAPTDPSAGDYKKGAHEVFDTSGVKIAKEYDTPDWSPDKAQNEAQQAITAIGKGNLAGVYSANDGMASGIISALKAAGVAPQKVPVTGGDAEIAAIQRILIGEQYSTIYLTIKKQAETSAELAVAAANGDKPKDGLITDKVNNGAKQVDSVLLDPVPVTKDNIKDTVIKDGFYTTKQICTAKYAKACAAAGVQ